ncbi:MAG: 4Fe-4S cluster-binding domain-containing protein [Promethearchaeota archaeon]|nr:MAG: 4Fe-4S cluster-binding domain-containing protein [Candidatus Lokiarchaeota archaeon]
MIIKTKEQNYYLNNRGIPKGCHYCLQGAKAVLFLNGKCQQPPHCSWYCPISEKRKGKNETYINEIQISSESQIFDELSKTDAEGLSITGGEPLYPPNLSKTIHYIKSIKRIMGSNFHIHLYTNGINFNEKTASQLARVGLDEIRFHPPKNQWDVIKMAINKGMDVGAEVPVIPGVFHEEELKAFITYIDHIGANFINLNEFEYCFPNSKELRKRGFTLKKGTIASVSKSREIALKVMQEMAIKTNLKMHFCSIKAKDYFQLKERYLRRATNIKTPYEEVTDEGLLLYGQIEGESGDLNQLFTYLQQESGIPDNLISFEREALLLPYYVLMDDEFLEFLKQFNVQSYVIESLPFDISKEKIYREITEKTPINIFKEEMDYYED